MKFLARFTKTIAILSLFLLVMFVSGFSPLTGAEPYVKVTLKNGTVEKFDYDSFSFNWTSPATITDQTSCEEVQISKEEIAEVYFIGEFFNTCVNKDDWEVDVYFPDRRQILGFFKVSDYSVKGRKLETGIEKSIAYSAIKKVTFYR
jgi:hypothetical protein